jgi:hypothetical protein
LVVSIPPPRCDHRQFEHPALAEKLLIGVRVMPANLLGRMSDVEFNGPATARLEVDEQEPFLRAEHVAGMGLTVEELLGGATILDLPAQVSQRVPEELSVGIGELRSTASIRYERLRLCDSIGEVRRRHVNLPHSGMKPSERVCVLARRGLESPRRFMVGPERDREPGANIDTWLHSRLKDNGGASGCCEPLRKRDFEFGHLLANTGDPSNDVTRHQAEGELVRVLKHDRVIDPQVKR